VRAVYKDTLLRRRPITMGITSRSDTLTTKRLNQTENKYNAHDLRSFELGPGSIRDKRRRLELFMTLLQEQSSNQDQAPVTCKELICKHSSYSSFFRQAQGTEIKTAAERDIERLRPVEHNPRLPRRRQRQAERGLYPAQPVLSENSQGFRQCQASTVCEREGLQHQAPQRRTR